MKIVALTIPKVERPAGIAIREQLYIANVSQQLTDLVWGVLTPVSLHIWRSLSKLR
jgi:hypothetical protein